MALNLLKTLVDMRCDFSKDTDAIVEKCTAAYNDKDHDFTIIYGDYYLTEAILKLCDKDLFLW